MSRSWWVVSVLVLELSARTVMRSQSLPPAADTAAFLKAIQLESDGKYSAAAPLYRASLYGANGQNALLGLERVYAELNKSDSLLAPLDTIIALNPRESDNDELLLRRLAPFLIAGLKAPFPDLALLDGEAAD